MKDPEIQILNFGFVTKMIGAQARVHENYRSSLASNIIFKGSIGFINSIRVILSTTIFLKKILRQHSIILKI